jgi:cell division control protein 7
MFSTNVPSVTETGITWNAFVTKLNPELYTPLKPDPSYYPYNTNYTESDALVNTDSLPPASSSSPSRGSSPASVSSTFAAQKENAAREAHKRDVDLAFSLLQGLLEPEAYKRTTPKDALAHEFLLEVDEPADEEMFPHPFGQGVCKAYHLIDQVTEEPCVVLYESPQTGQTTRHRRTRPVAPGQGIAIGRQPCEFHKDISLYD